jgi:hypothetical protein
MPDYPKQMHHPGFAPAVLDEVKPLLSRDGYGSDGMRVNAARARPARYPPVMVNNEDQHAYYESRGYVVGKPPPTPQPRPSNGYQERKNIRSHTYEPPPEGEEYEYPKWVGDKIAKSAEEEAALLEEAAQAKPNGEAHALDAVDPDELAEFRAWKKSREQARPTKPKRELSEEQRQALRDRLAAAREVRRQKREQNAQTNADG